MSKTENSYINNAMQFSERDFHKEFIQKTHQNQMKNKLSMHK
jgi:hypothetical protein